MYNIRPITKSLWNCLKTAAVFAAVNAYGYKTGRLFVPIDVGKEAVRVRFKKTVQDIMFPKDLNYHFSGAMLSVTHPTGKCEKITIVYKGTANDFIWVKHRAA